MKNIPGFLVHRFLLVLGLVLTLPAFAAMDALLDWLAERVPGFDWFHGSAHSLDGQWAAIPVYLVLVAVYSLAGIVLNLAFLQSYGAPRAEGSRGRLSLVVGAAFFLALVAVLRGWLFLGDIDAVAFAASVANLLLLLTTFGISVRYRPESFALQNTRSFQAVSVAGCLVIAWAAGIAWALN